jgi:hypothetical protein
MSISGENLSFIMEFGRENIPAELRNRRQWVNHDAEKVPYTPGTERRAASTDSETWKSFEEAAADGRGLGSYSRAGIRTRAWISTSAGTPRRAPSNLGHGKSSRTWAATSRPRRRGPACTSLSRASCPSATTAVSASRPTAPSATSLSRGLARGPDPEEAGGARRVLPRAPARPLSTDRRRPKRRRSYRRTDPRKAPARAER